MTIMEIPQRARVTARLPGGRFVARFLGPFFGTHQAGGGVRSLPRGSEMRPAENGAPIWPTKRITDSNAPLDSLAGLNLASRFHAWRGASGRRYICSVFSVDRSDQHAGLPDFDAAIALAVAFDEAGRRRRVSLLCHDATADAAARRQFIAAALAKGAIEWHIHLLAEDAQQRMAVAADLDWAQFAEVLSVR